VCVCVCEENEDGRGAQQPPTRETSLPFPRSSFPPLSCFPNAPPLCPGTLVTRWGMPRASL
jgi:hypothetical protein